ncbi:MAG: NIPSNAP family protein [Fuerstiella sp.]
MTRCIAVFVLAGMFIPSASAFEDSRVFEMRTYFANEGKLDALLSRFRDHTVELFTKHGITNVGYWVPQKNDDNTLVYIVAFPNEEARSASWKAFLADPKWKAAYKASTADGKLVAKIESVFLTATDYSPAIKPSQTDKARLFELRTYTTNTEKLDALNRRFRDHTTKLFTKHHLQQFGYWVPMKEADGASNKLVYLLAHESVQSRKAGFKAFGQDPAWKTAKNASETDGPLLIPKGVKSQFLIPTDFSPTR